MGEIVLSQEAMRQLMAISLDVESLNDKTVIDGEYEITMWAKVDRHSELESLEFEIYNEEGEEQDICNEQYAEIRNSIEQDLYYAYLEAEEERRNLSWLLMGY